MFNKELFERLCMKYASSDECDRSIVEMPDGTIRQITDEDIKDVLGDGEILYWKDLTEDAKAIIEWVENPFTDEREPVTIEIGQRFIRENLPEYCDDKKVDILVTRELFEEINKYVQQNYDFAYEESGNILTFKLKDVVYNLENGAINEKRI